MRIDTDRSKIAARACNSLINAGDYHDWPNTPAKLRKAIKAGKIFIGFRYGYGPKQHEWVLKMAKLK